MHMTGIFVNARGKPITTCSRHNTTLKWMRIVAERWGSQQIVFNNDVAIDVPRCDHAVGTDFTFDESTTDFQWRWQSMVAQLSDASLDIIFGDAVAEPSADQVVCKCAILGLDRPGFKVIAAC